MKKITSKNIETLFKCIYLVHLLLAFNAVINRTSVLKVTLILTMILGAVVAVLKLKDSTKYFLYKNFWLLNFFVISYVISSVLNYKYGILDNIQGFVWLCAQIWILYLVNKDLSLDEIKKEFELIIKIFLVVVSFYNIISLLMFVLHYTKADFSEGQYILGFIWGRLWGIYDDPNHGSVISVSAILIGIYLLWSYKKKIIKVILIASIIVQGIYIYLSDSRTGIICMAIGIAIMLAYYIYNIVCSKKIFLSIVTFICTIMVVLVLELPVQKGMSILYNSNICNFEIDNENGVEEKEMVTVGRSDMESDPSNRRFDIWNSGIEMFSNNTLFGISRFNFLSYAEKELPETYIVNNDFQKFDSMHNMPLDVLISQGLVGICILLLIVVRSIIYIINNIQIINKQNSMLLLILLAIILVNGVSSIFISTVVYINSPATYIFWISFGYCMRIISLHKINNSNVELVCEN